MKQFQSITENEWFKINNLNLTKSENELLKSTNEEDRVAKEELINSINVKRKTALTKTESKIYVNLYNKIKPTLTETDIYQLISCDITLVDKLSGILNCRINGEHKQIRF